MSSSMNGSGGGQRRGAVSWLAARVAVRGVARGTGPVGDAVWAARSWAAQLGAAQSWAARSGRRGLGGAAVLAGRGPVPSASTALAGRTGGHSAPGGGPVQGPPGPGRFPGAAEVSRAGEACADGRRDGCAGRRRRDACAGRVPGGTGPRGTQRWPEPPRARPAARGGGRPGIPVAPGTGRRRTGSRVAMSSAPSRRIMRLPGSAPRRAAGRRPPAGYRLLLHGQGARHPW